MKSNLFRYPIISLYNKKDESNFLSAVCNLIELLKLRSKKNGKEHLFLGCYEVLFNSN